MLYVAGQLGHSSPNVTLGTYAHLVREGRRLNKEETLRKIEMVYRVYPVLTQRGEHRYGTAFKPRIRCGGRWRT